MRQWPHCPVSPALLGEGEFQRPPWFSRTSDDNPGTDREAGNPGSPQPMGPTSPRNTPDHASRSQERHSRSRPAH